MIAQIQKEIKRALAKLQFFAIGKITKIDFKNYMVKAEILTTGMITNWLRIGEGYVGDGFGEAKAPNIGDEIFICFPDGDPSGQGVVIRRLYGKDMPPEINADEIIIHHKSGIKIIIYDDGTVKIKSDNIQLGPDGQHKALWGDKFLPLYDDHRHPTPNGPSGKPVYQIPDAQVNSQKVTLD